MNASGNAISLVERKRYDEKKPHQVARGIWWVGFFDTDSQTSHNTYLLVDNDEAVLINPGSGAKEHYQAVSKKVSAIIKPNQIEHIVVHHHDPDRCAAIPHFEKTADRNVRLYAPSQVVKSIKYYGCKNPVIALDGGDSIILQSGRTIDYYATPGLPMAGSGFLFDSTTGTAFSGNICGCPRDEWNLFAAPNSWEGLIPCNTDGAGSKKALMIALNKLERLSPERICPQFGPVIEENLDKFIAAARNLDRPE